MKHSRSRFLLLVVALAMLFTLAACGGQEAPEVDEEEPVEEVDAGEEVAAEPEGEQVTVRVLTMQQAGPTPEEMNAIVDSFNETQPGIVVQIDYVSYDALHDKIVTSMASSPPAYDVILVDDIWYAEFADSGYLWDVTDLVGDETISNIFDSAWGISTVDGRIYGMPWLLDAKYFFYNEALLSEAGFDAPPRTWEELVAQSQAIKEQGIVEYPIVWSWAQAEAAICDLVTLLQGNGSGFVDDQGNPIFNDEAGVEALAWMVDTVNQGISNPASISYVEEDVRNVFSSGNAVFATNWLYMYELADLDPAESQITGDVRMALMPVFEEQLAAGVDSATINGSMGFSVVAGSPNAEAAWEYVKYLTSEAIQMQYASHLLPVWETAYEGENLETLAEMNPATEATVPMFSEQFPYAHVRPKVPFYPEASKTLQLAMQRALTGQASPQEALDEAAATWNELRGE
ncbi:MAG: extracellular solute-binding protein [Chloroflexi bacterium]|nr:extracellular solute-binding protein [Chloroflexota bacterium]